MAFAINQGFVQNSNGRVQPGATVTVYLDIVGQPLATQVYADRDGVTPKGNPFLADGDGYYFFYAPGGAYKLVATYNGSSRTFRHTALGLLSEADEVVGGAPYVEGSWTPTLTFDTPGDLAVAYSARSGTYERIGRRIFADFVVATSSFTHTTASGNLKISGLPLTPNAAANHRGGSLLWSGITKAGYSDLVPTALGGTDAIVFNAMGSGQAASSVQASDVPSGGAIILRGMATFFI